MTTITLPPDLDRLLTDEAHRRGTTTERLVLEGLRRLFAESAQNGAPPEHPTLFDFLAGQIGTIAGSSEDLSQECGRRFSAGLAEKQQRGGL
jgi:hypothetical protein